MGNRIYYLGPQRYHKNGRQFMEYIKSICEFNGFELVNDLSIYSDDLKNYEKIDRTHLDNCDIVVADVNFFRGGNPESGTIFEFGMAFAKNKKLYSFTKNLCNCIHKYPHVKFRDDGSFEDEHGLRAADLMTPGNLMYVTPGKMVEGEFNDCLKIIKMDIIEELKEAGQRITPKVDNRSVQTLPIKEGKYRAYLAGTEVFRWDRDEEGNRMKKVCEELGFEGLFPNDAVFGLSEVDPSQVEATTFLSYIFDRDQAHIRNSNVVIANMNDFHGKEPDAGTVFEAGMCYGLGYDCYLFVDTDKTMIERIECYKDENGIYHDVEGYIVEDYGFPVSHKLATCMKIVIGKFDDAAKFAAKDLGLSNG